MRTQLRGSHPREQCRHRLGWRSRGLLGEVLFSPQPWQRWVLTLIIQQTCVEHLFAKHRSGCWGHIHDHSSLKVGVRCGDKAQQGGEVGGTGICGWWHTVNGKVRVALTEGREGVELTAGAGPRGRAGR